MFTFFDVRYKDIVDIPKLNIDKGFTALLGASGSGKTTVLRMLNKMISPTHGRIFFNGTDIGHIESVKIRRNVMMLSQNPVIFEGTIKDNLTIAFDFQDREIPSDDALSTMLTKVQLSKSLDTAADQLSGGEKQKLALGRLLLLDPEVYLLDEPSAALDSETEDMIIHMLSKKVKEEAKSVIMVTHARSVAEKYADDMIEMMDGKIIKWRGGDEGND